MKRLSIIVCVVMVMASGISTVSAENYPATNAPAAGPRQTAGTPGEQMIYGYVPPPPIRHTWPGGYKVLFHELLNTLSQHMLGHY